MLSQFFKSIKQYITISQKIGAYRYSHTDSCIIIDMNPLGRQSRGSVPPHVAPDICIMEQILHPIFYYYRIAFKCKTFLNEQKYGKGRKVFITISLLIQIFNENVD